MQAQQQRVENFIIFDNQALTHLGLRALVKAMFVGIGTIDVSDKKTLFAHLEAHPESVVIIDYSLSDFSTIDNLFIAIRRFPFAYWFFIGNELSHELVSRLSAERNVAIALKEVSEDELRTGLNCSARHERFFCHQVTDMLLDKQKENKNEEHLTATEIEILKLIAQGKTVKEIAAARMSSSHTIISHKKNIFRKLDVNNIFEATRYAVRAGLVEMVDYYI